MSSMREIYALELSLLVKELKAFEGFYINKFYEMADGTFRMRLSRRGEKADLICTLKLGIWRASEVTVQESPTQFVAAVRKRASGYSIESIEQLNSDRIIIMRLKKGDSRIAMLFEMIAKGNLIMLEGDSKISLAYKQGSFKERNVRVGAAYIQPKSEFIDYRSLPEFIKESGSTDATIISLLGRAVNLGPLYIEEALARSGIGPKKSAHEITGENAEEIVGSIEKILEEANSSNYFVYKKDGANVDYSVCKIKKYDGMEKEMCKTVQQLLDIFHSRELLKQKEEVNEALKELEESIKKQKKLMEGFDDRIAADKETAEAIFKNMQLINNMITMLQHEKRLTREELQMRFAEAKILELDLKKKSFTIEV